MILSIDEPLDMFQYRVTVIAGLGERGVGVGAEQHRVGAVDADEPQLAQALRNGFRVLSHIVRGGSSPDCWCPVRMPTMPAAA